MSNNPHLSDDALASLNEIVQDTPNNRLVERQEIFRLALTQAMRNLRKRLGFTQKEMGERFGVGQSWVSKLEDIHNDHTFDSVLTYLNALGADFEAAILVKKQRVEIIPANLTVHKIDLEAAINAIFEDADYIEPVKEVPTPDFNLISPEERETCHEAQRVRDRQGGSWGRDSVA
ncbi:MAG: helix-turn-helix domain-containing protein [Nostoc sp. ChiSLP01]|nr:helix-turn-helix domain-containing protein [Nostoc sp. CmiSLP01]MDZ8284666.1 helix-turn-helix domain-containing protein [Nostoc sp. ChiSLP01]